MSQVPSPTSPEPQFSLVVPVFRNAGGIAQLLERLRDLARRLDGRLECVIVVDGSPDDSDARLREALPGEPYRSQLVLLSRNFGTWAAVRAGLGVARGSFFAVMSADLQEPAETILEFFDVLRRDVADVAVGVRAGRDDPLTARLAAQSYWAAYRQLVQRDIPAGGIDMFGCNERVRRVLLALDEANSSLVGLVIWLGFRRHEVVYRRQPSVNEKSGWSLRRKIRYMLDSVFSFTDLPVMLLMAVGLLGILGALAVGVFVFASWALGLIEVQGYTPLMLTLLFLVFANLLGLGIVGSYVWRTFENTKRRPLYVIMERDDFGR
jgi:glycosyltransferase involved in cell wall biosynthesis